MAAGSDLFNRADYNTITVPLDERFPKYLVENRDRFRNYIKEV